MTYPKNAKEAFDQGMTYRPRVWGIGSMPYTPRENGVESIGGELVLFRYQNHQAANRVPWTTKHAILRKEAGPQKDPYQSDYLEVA